MRLQGHHQERESSWPGKDGKKGSKTRKTVGCSASGAWLLIHATEIEKLKALLGEEEEPEEVSEEHQRGKKVRENDAPRSQLDFAKALQEEQKRKIHVDMKTVRRVGSKM